MQREYIRLRERIVNGPIVSTLLWLSIPPLVNQLVQVSYNIIDSIWLKTYAETAIAVPRQIWPLIFLTFMIGMGFSIANLAMISQYVGAKRYKEADKVASNLYFFLVFLGIGFGVFFYLAKEYILAYVMHVPPEIYSWSVSYASIVSLGVPFGMMSFAFTTILQAVGDTKTPTIIQSASALMNIVLDPILIFGFTITLPGLTIVVPAMGVAGAAAATVISRAVTTSIGMYLLVRGYRGIRIEYTGLKIDPVWLINSLKIGGPVILLRIANVSSFAVLQILVNLFGVEAATAYSIGFIVINLSDAILWGFSRAVSVIVGQNLGAGRYDRAREAVYKALMIVLVATTIGSAIVYLLRDPLVSWFTQNLTIHAMATRLVEIFGLSIPFFAMFFISMSVGNGSGHTIPPSVIGLIRLWGVRIGLGYLLAFKLGLGIEWLWIAMGLSNVFAGIVGVLWIVFGNWTIPIVHSLGGMKGIGKLGKNITKPGSGN